MILIKDIQTWQNVLSAISFLKEANFRFSSEGLKLKALDKSQSILVDLFIPKKAFAKYDIEPAYLGLGIEDLNKISQRALPNDFLKITISDSSLDVVLEGKFERTFQLPLLQIDDNIVKDLVIQNPYNFSISAQEFKELLRDASLFSKNILFKIEDSVFFTEALGPSGHQKTIIKKKVSAEPLIAKYDLFYLQTITKAAQNKLNISLANDSPIKISYNLGKANLTFYLAHMLL